MAKRKKKGGFVLHDRHRQRVNIWTAARLEVLKRGMAAGTSATVLAREIGVTHQATRNKIADLNHARRPRVAEAAVLVVKYLRGRGDVVLPRRDGRFDHNGRVATFADLLHKADCHFAAGEDWRRRNCWAPAPRPNWKAVAA